MDLKKALELRKHGSQGGKYLKRTGSPGNYKYVYEEPKDREPKEEENKKETPGLVKKKNDGFYYDGTIKVTRDPQKAREYVERKAKKEEGHTAPPLKAGEGVRIKSSAKNLGRGIMGKIKEIGKDFVRIVTDDGKYYRVPKEALEFARSKQYKEDPLIKGVLLKDVIPLKGMDMSDDEFDPEQLAMGLKVEFEHTDDPELAKGIAKGHLVEDPLYYTKLKIMENVKNKKGMQRKILEFFKQNPNPKDVKIHKLASQMKMDVHKFESQIYKLVSEYAKML